MPPDIRRDRIGLDPAGHRIAVRDERYNDWFIVDTAKIPGQFMASLPDDWTVYVPATDRDLMAEHVAELVDKAEEFADGLAWLQSRAATGEEPEAPHA
jgi:hypothetical protein